MNRTIDPFEKGLKYCPFCRRNDMLTIETDISSEDGRLYAYHVLCRNCGCRGRNRFRIGWCETRLSAIEAWQDRGSIENGEEEQIDFELTGAEIPNRITLNVPDEWFNAHDIRMGRKGKAIISGLDRR